MLGQRAYNSMLDNEKKEFTVTVTTCKNNSLHLNRLCVRNPESRP